MQGQFHNKGSALSFFAFHPDGAPVKQHQLVHNGKAQARAALFPAAGFIHPIEAVKNMGQVFLGNAGAVIGNGQLGFPALALERHLHLAALLGMSHSAISHQLRILRSAKLVKNSRKGKRIYYTLADSHVQGMLEQGLEHVRE